MTIEAQLDAPAAAQVAPPRVRMDRSRAFATVNGDRSPGDRHASVFFIQDGIPADAGGFFIFDHPDMARKGPDGDKARKAAERKIKKALTQQAKEPVRQVAPGDDADEDDEGVAEVDKEDEDEELLEPINLEAWLRGEQQVEWQEISQEIARRYKKRVAKIEDAVGFLVKEGVVPKAQLKPKFQKFAD
jgi:hypothetical protein